MRKKEDRKDRPRGHKGGPWAVLNKKAKKTKFTREKRPRIIKSKRTILPDKDQKNKTQKKVKGMIREAGTRRKKNTGQARIKKYRGGEARRKKETNWTTGTVKTRGECSTARNGMSQPFPIGGKGERGEKRPRKKNTDARWPKENKLN